MEIPQALLSFVRQGATLRKAMLAGQGNDFGESSTIGAELDGRGMATEREMVDGPSIPDLVRRNSQSIDMLCAVLNGPNAALAQKRVKRRLLEDVLPDLDVSLPANDDDPTFRIVFEYATAAFWRSWPTAPKRISPIPSRRSCNVSPPKSPPPCSPSFWKSDQPSHLLKKKG